MHTDYHYFYLSLLSSSLTISILTCENLLQNAQNVNAEDEAGRLREISDKKMWNDSSDVIHTTNKAKQESTTKP